LKRRIYHHSIRPMIVAESNRRFIRFLNAPLAQLCRTDELALKMAFQDNF